MIHHRKIICLVLFAATAAAGLLHAQTVSVTWSAFGAGGNRMATPGLFLTAALGPAAAGRSAAGNTVITSGFLAARIVPGQTTEVPEPSPSRLPSEFRLLQNYPNPFNPSTMIGFHTLEAGYVTLKVYDILGRELATLVNGMTSAGDYTVSWNAEGMGSGVYLYRLSAGGVTKTLKMVVAK